MKRNIKIKKGDILGYAGGSWISKVVRWFEKGYNEKPSFLSHCGIFISDTNDLSNALVIEALMPAGVVVRGFLNSYKDDLKNCYILRPKNISQEQRETIVRTAKLFLGDKYGVAKIIPHAIDGLLAKVLRKRDFRFFRNLCQIDDFPICSYLVARSYAEADLDFGIKYSFATPDDIWDFAETNKDKYSIIKFLNL